MKGRLRTQVIVNPESNRGRTRQRWKEIKEAIRGVIQEFRCEFTEKYLQAIAIAREAIRSGHELIIGVGGDGTMNEIANGFFDGRRIIYPETTLGILPSGTGSDLTKSLKIPAGIKGALKVITQGTSVRIDGRELPEGEYLIGAVANGRIFGKGMKFAPVAELDDGQFDIILVKAMSFGEFCRHGWKIFFGKHLSHRKIRCIRGQSVEAFSPGEEDVLLELDGEQWGSLPAPFEILPSHLLVKGSI